MASSARFLRSCTLCLHYRMKSIPLQSARIMSAQKSYHFQQKRDKTQILERVYPLPAGKDGGLPDERQYNELHKILRPVEILEYPAEMTCILTDFVEGIGIRGDVVSVDRNVFHQKLYPALLAVYASPENIEEFKQERKDKGIEKSETRLGVFARMAIKELNQLKLEIPMNENQSWTLTKSHVAVALRIQGIEIEEECITLPENPVTEFLTELTINVEINGLESATVNATIVPISEKFSQQKKT